MHYYIFIMKTNEVSYLKIDDNTIINENCIRWVKKMNECLHVCARPDGCNIEIDDTRKICKINNPESYMKLNQFFTPLNR
jgi:hypothetical protein